MVVNRSFVCNLTSNDLLQLVTLRCRWTSKAGSLATGPPLRSPLLCLGSGEDSWAVVVDAEEHGKRLEACPVLRGRCCLGHESAQEMHAKELEVHSDLSVQTSFSKIGSRCPIHGLARTGSSLVTLRR